MAKPKRVPLNRLVLPGTFTLVKTLAEQLECSEGDVLDKAVALLASGKAFGLNHIRLPSESPRELTVEPIEDI